MFENKLKSIFDQWLKFYLGLNAQPKIKFWNGHYWASRCLTLYLNEPWKDNYNSKFDLFRHFLFYDRVCEENEEDKIMELS